MPLTFDGLCACHTLTSKGRMAQCHIVLCFSANRDSLAAAGATFTSPLIGRIDNMGVAFIALIAEIRHIYENSSFGIEIARPHR